MDTELVKIYKTIAFNYVVKKNNLYLNISDNTTWQVLVNNATLFSEYKDAFKEAIRVQGTVCEVKTTYEEL